MPVGGAPRPAGMTAIHTRVPRATFELGRLDRIRRVLAGLVGRQQPSVPRDDPTFGFDNPRTFEEGFDPGFFNSALTEYLDQRIQRFDAEQRRQLIEDMLFRVTPRPKRQKRIKGPPIPVADANDPAAQRLALVRRIALAFGAPAPLQGGGLLEGLASGRIF